MSILKIINEELVIISHEEYLKDAYKNVEGTSFKYCPDLFAINEPFKTYNKTKKKQEDSSIKNYPYQMYTENATILKEHIAKFYKQIIDNEINTASRKRHSDQLETKRYQFPNERVLNKVNEIQSTVQTSEQFLEYNGSNPYDYPINREFNGGNYLFPPKSTFYCMDIKNMRKIPPENKYNLIVIDPPWTNKAIRRKNKKQLENSSFNGYTFMSNSDIKDIPIDDYLTQDGVVLVWCTNAVVHRKAVDEFFATWKLIKVGLWYWLKVTTQGEPVIPFTKEELHMKQPFEVMIIGTRKGLTSKWKIASEGMFVSVPCGVHSHKPPLSDALVKFILGREMLAGSEEKGKDWMCLEIFARSLIPGWTSIGNEVLKLQNLYYYEEEEQTELLSKEASRSN